MCKKTEMRFLIFLSFSKVIIYLQNAFLRIKYAEIPQ